MKRLAIVLSHPIQYYSPIFELLTTRNNISVKVFYTLERESVSFDKGFGLKVQWDIPLLKGYEYQFVSNNGNLKKGFFDVKNPDLIQQIQNWNPDAILVFGWSYYSHLKVLSFFKGKIPVLFRGDSNMLDEKPGFKQLIRRLFLRYVYSNVDIALYVGKMNKEYFKVHGLKENQLKYAPHAVDNERFGSEINSDKAEQVRVRFNIPMNSTVVLFAGKFQAKKNPAILIDAFIRLNKPDAHLMLVGNGDLEEVLKLQAKNHPRIHFAGFQNQSELPAYYASSDLFCLPSNGPGETWGLAINEAMAAENAILASNKCGGAYDLVFDGINGYMFEANNTADLQNKLRELLADKVQLRNFGTKSKEIIQQFSFDSIVNEIENVVN